MKIKSIAAICKKGKQVVLYNRYESGGTLQQYIGDGMTAYPVSGLPKLDEESILTIFDVPEKQREDWFVRVRDVPEGINFEDTDANEKMIERDNLSIIFSGHTLKPLQTRRGLVFIQSRYLSPVSDVLDVLELYERFTPNGTPYIVAKAGLRDRLRLCRLRPQQEERHGERSKERRDGINRNRLYQRRH